MFAVEGYPVHVVHVLDDLGIHETHFVVVYEKEVE